VLDCLRRYGARSTFFVMAERALRHGVLIERMRAEGHEVAFHCLRHVRHSEMHESAVRRDTAEGLRLLRTMGIDPRRWRPPWGVVTAATRRVAGAFDLELAGWDVDSEDWRGDAAVRMHERMLDDLRAGAVVLLHDGLGPGVRRSGCRQTVELIPRLLETIHERGLRAVRLAELAE
jgi:peptidoglycan/xylan/chitin deacetylase (PgdA/CDA1 family)